MTLKDNVLVNSEDIGAIAVLQNRLYVVLYFPKEEEEEDDQELFWDWAREKGILLFLQSRAGAAV